jgi:hypothetical protein
VEESDIIWNENPGSLLIAFPIRNPLAIFSPSGGGVGIAEKNIPSFGSATTREAFFSSLTESRRLESIGETLFSTMHVTSSSAAAALSNFENCFNFRLIEAGVSSRNSCRKDKEGIHAGSTLGGAHFFGQIILLEQFPVLRFEQSITRAGLGED